MTRAGDRPNGQRGDAARPDLHAFATLFLLTPETLRAAETTGASGALPVEGVAALIVVLGGVLLICLHSHIMQRESLRALEKLATIALQLRNGQPTTWRDTGVARIDAIAGLLEEFDQRLRYKREKLTELNADIASAHARPDNRKGFNNYLRAIIDAIPVGVLLAEAPSGRILEGNRAIENILRHPVIYSENAASSREWTGFHANGAPVQCAEYPLARALAGEDRPSLECHYHRGDGSRGWINILGAPLRDERGEIVGAIVVAVDIDDIKMAEARAREMMMELHHRVNNSLAMIQGVTNLTARTATDFDSFRESFSDRIQSLSRISTLLVRNSWGHTAVRDLLATALETNAEPARNVALSGEDCALRSEVALAVGMAMHELYSNAIRFGALSCEGGAVAVNWRCDDSQDRRRLVLNWAESGGPAVAQPDRRGVGTLLMTDILSAQLGGAVTLDFDAAGLRAEISATI